MQTLLFILLILFYGRARERGGERREIKEREEGGRERKREKG